MNIIIVGGGKVGIKLAEKLSLENEHNITLLDLRNNIVQDATGLYDIMGVTGSGISSEALIEAGIEKANLLIAVTGSDELNIIICLLARKLGSHCKTIARIRKPDYHNELHLIKEDLGLAMIMNPELAAATEMARILRFPSAIEIDTFAKGRVEILKFKITDDSPLCDMKIMDLSHQLKCDVLVCGVERDEEAFIPGGNFVIKAGDLISVVSSISNVTDFFKKIGIKTNRVKDVMIVGGGDTAYYLAKQLLQTGTTVKIIERNQTRCEELCELLPKASIINADGTETRTLLEEGLETTGAFVSLTNIDEENVLLSLFAKTKTEGKLITKINKIEYDNVIGDLDIDSVIYPKNITADYILRFVRAANNSLDSEIETMREILDGKAEALEFIIRDSSPVSDIPLMELNIKKNTLVACITRGNKIFTPRGNDCIKKGDSVVIVTTEKGFNEISDILE